MVFQWLAVYNHHEIHQFRKKAESSTIAIDYGLLNSPNEFGWHGTNDVNLLLLFFISEITMYIVFRKGVAANTGLPSEQVDRRWEDSKPQTSRPNVTALSD